ncbi:hypothetical protein SCEN_N03000 [Saccharomyces cerevisiae]|nr:hypothetical protein SCEN_N03000 [Saccharomyces cerevisiae]
MSLFSTCIPIYLVLYITYRKVHLLTLYRLQMRKPDSNGCTHYTTVVKNLSSMFLHRY